MVSEEQPINKFMKLQKARIPQWASGKTIVSPEELKKKYTTLKKGETIYLLDSRENTDFWSFFTTAEEVTNNFKVYRIERGQFYVCEVWK